MTRRTSVAVRATSSASTIASAVGAPAAAASSTASSTAPAPLVGVERREEHEQWLKDLTCVPTAAGREHRVIEWVRRWVSERGHLALDFDKAGNALITRRRGPGAAARKPRAGRAASARGALAPLLITAHLDHPAFVVRSVISADTLELEFRGGVYDPYFANAAIEIFDAADRRHAARIVSLDSGAKPFHRAMARLHAPASTLAAGDIGRWIFQFHAGTLPRVDRGILHTHACDDLAAVAAALAALDIVAEMRGTEHVGVLLTRAEEVGFIGAIAACKNKSIARGSRLICLENSRSFPHDSPIGAGPIVRVGDKLSVFEPTLTNEISALVEDHHKFHPTFKYQRKLMPGGTCEATTFSAYGHRSTCLCLPLGNYHNMMDIDGVVAGKTKLARVGPEFISLDDYHGLVEMLIVCATRLDAPDSGGAGRMPTLKAYMETLNKRYGFVLDEAVTASGE